MPGFDFDNIRMRMEAIAAKAQELAAKKAAEENEKRRIADVLAASQREAEALKQQQAKKAQEQIERINKISSLNSKAVLALETGNIEDVKALYVQLPEEADRQVFILVQPLLLALDKQQFKMAEYLVDLGFKCPEWSDYVTEANNPELYKKLELRHRVATTPKLSKQ